MVSASAISIDSYGGSNKIFRMPSWNIFIIEFANWPFTTNNSQEDLIYYWNRWWHSPQHRACWRYTPKPCWPERPHEECTSRTNNHQEFDVGWTDCRPRNASAVQPRRMLYWRWRSRHCTRAEKRENVHSRYQQCWHCNVRQRAKGRDRHRSVAQEIWPNKIPLVQDMQAKQVVFGLPKFSGCKVLVCEACQLGKQHRLPFPNERNRSQNRLDLIHTNVWGPAQNESTGGNRYFITFIDDGTLKV